MQKKEIIKCDSRFSGPHIGLVIGAVVLGLVVLVAIGAVFSRRQMMQNYAQGNAVYGHMNRWYVPTPNDQQNDFAPPLDASKKGQIAIIVDNLDAARKAVSDAASSNGGSVYSTFVAYATGDPKNGSIVVKVPENAFDKTFDDLKKVGSQVVQESSSQVDKRISYPVPLAAQTDATSSNTDTTNASNKSVKNAKAANSKTQESQEEAPAVIAQPAYPAQEPAQDQGYIKVVFVDYGGQKIQNQNKSLTGLFNYVNQNPDKALLIAIALKMLLLLVFVIFLAIMMIRALRHLRRPRKIRPAVHVVRQMPKSSKRVVKVAKKK